ncbi:class I SAM-dependent methyltransferase [Rhodocista pekingensis]|uniref:Class I SAM-dependent methyltransferase n=1 Tax=Rhodocista pekingensis TaxID=201185 RepID=A0ABW2KUX4_9PROT
MATVTERTAGRLAYAMGHAARVGWFLGQYALAARLGGTRPDPQARPPGPFPSTAEVLADLRGLLERDWRNIEAGLYRMPHDLVGNPRRLLADAARFLRDVPEVQRRRRSGGNAEVFRAPLPGSEKLPRYYRQNFHFQTDGYLSDRSARLYDHQVEVLFGGGADAMRRQVLVPLAEHLRGRPVRDLRLLDVAAGTGRFLTFVKDNWPRLDVTALDLSAPYLAQARRTLSPWSRHHAVQAPAEAMPFPDASFDVVTCIFLLHELPQAVRARAAAEMARVLKPGGLLVVMDSLQTGDKPRFDALLRLFPVAFHEPYYGDYVARDVAPLFTAQGLEEERRDLAFMSKLVAFRRSAAPVAGP